MYRLLFLLLMFLSGCFGYVDLSTGPKVPPGGQLTIPIWVDSDFEIEAAVEIDGALIEWNKSLNGFIILHVAEWHFDEKGGAQNVADQDGFVFVSVVSSDPIVSKYHSSRTLAWCDAVGGNWMYVVRDRVPVSELRGVVLHEIGHLLGVEHGGEGLMQPVYSHEDMQCVDPWTASMVERAVKIPAGSIYYCEANHQPALEQQQTKLTGLL